MLPAVSVRLGVGNWTTPLGPQPGRALLALPRARSSRARTRGWVRGRL